MGRCERDGRGAARRGRKRARERTVAAADAEEEGDDGGWVAVSATGAARTDGRARENARPGVAPRRLRPRGRAARGGGGRAAAERVAPGVCGGRVVAVRRENEMGPMSGRSVAECDARFFATGESLSEERKNGPNGLALRRISGL